MLGNAANSHMVLTIIVAAVATTTNSTVHSSCHRPLLSTLFTIIWEGLYKVVFIAEVKYNKIQIPREEEVANNALGDVKDQAEDKANLKPWYTADKKLSKMSTEDLLMVIQEYPLPEGWYARLPSLQELANYGTKFETGIYEEQVKSRYRLPLHPFTLRFFEHYHMAPQQLVPNGWRKLVGLIYLVQTSGYKPDTTDFMRGKRKEKQPSVELHLAPNKTRVTPPDRSLRIVERVSIDEYPIFRPRWTFRCDDIGMPDSQISKQHQFMKFFLGTRRFFKTRLTRPLPMYASGSEMLSRFEMARQIETLERRLERVKRKATEEVKKAQDQGIRDFLNGNVGEEWLKKQTDDGLEIYEMTFMKAKEMFHERFPDIPLDDFVMPAVVSPSGETAMPSKAGDAAASHPPEEGPSGDAPEL
ncbi:hypothetical protein RJ639_035432 [Escallonia herrerae]|uniref:Transposase (putative) gypsy type domain-containing protein n=1 Tax=Escallonia herrerae TaxID=1293975 RepID=A0AA89BB93_9ASTE|nr:hypothetical protein RJ639_035432 [Escallonia herrerae]